MTEKIIYLDVETTGLDSNKCGIWQLGAIIEIDGVEKEIINFKMNPGEVEYQAGALLTCNIKRSEIEAFPRQAEKFIEFITILNKYVRKFDKTDKLKLVCHNVSFDFDFLIKWFVGNGDNYLGSFIDYKKQFCTFRVFQALRFLNQVQGMPETEPNKLESICKHLNIELTDAHDALADIRACKALYKWEMVKITERTHEGK